MTCKPVRPALAMASLPVAILSLLLAAPGCGRSSAPPTAAKTRSHDHDHGHGHDHEHPTTFAGAVEEIGTRLASLEKAVSGEELTEKQLDVVDSLVHDIGHLMEDGENLLEKVPAAVAAKARDAWKDLDECLGAVDEKLHADGDDRKTVKGAYEAVKSRIGEAMESLRAAVKAAEL